MLIPLHHRIKSNIDDTADDAAFEEFLTQEGLGLLRSYREIKPAEIRLSIRKLVKAIQESLTSFIPPLNDAKSSEQSSIIEDPLKFSPPVWRIAKHGINYPHTLTAAEIQLVCRAVVQD